MLETYSVVDVPHVSADSPDAARRLLLDYAHTPTLAAVIHDVPADSLEGAKRWLRENDILPATMSTDPLTRDFEFGDKGQHGHVGLHTDYEPLEEGKAWLANSLHFTDSGLAVASIAKVGPRFAELRAENGGMANLGTPLIDDFKNGLVDPGIIDPTCYRTELRPRTLLAFKNGQSLWHLMDTVGDGRRSVVHETPMDITPGMEVPFHDGPLPPLRSVWNDDPTSE